MDMRTGRLRSALWVALVIAIWAGSSHGDLTVSVTISGPIDEILPLLEQLKDMGVGAPSTDESLRVELRSVAKAPEAAEPPKPPLALEALLDGHRARDDGRKPEGKAPEEVFDDLVDQRPPPRKMSPRESASRAV